MKAIYIKPETNIVASLAMESLLNSASQSNIKDGPSGLIDIA